MSPIWARLEDFPDYAVSYDGEVMRVAPGHGARPGWLLKPAISRKGYLRVKLYRNGVRMWRRIHRLVAKTFLPNPENLPEVNHQNRDKMNNGVDNLEWVTHQANIDHYVESVKGAAA